MMLVAATLIAQEEPADTALYGNINEVIVTANRYTEVIPSQKLTGKELTSLNTLSVADALRYFSGVQIKDYGGVGGIKTVNIRSMGTNHVGVYFNGIELGNAQNGQVDLGKYSLENVEEISLYNGQRSDIFQTAREFGDAGSIYITTRKPKFEGNKRTNIRAGVKAGSFDLFDASLNLEYKISDDVSANFSGEWTSSSGKYKFRYRRVTPSGEVAYDTTATRANGDLDAVRVEGGVQGTSGPVRWRGYVYHYSSERGIPGAIVNNVWRRGERLWDRNSFVQGSAEWDATERWSLKFNAKYAMDYTRYVNNDEKLIHVDNIYKQREVYLSWANKVNILRNWDFSAAYDMQYNSLREYTHVDRFTHWFSAATSYNLANRLKLQASALATIVDEEERERTDAPTKTKITPAVFASYKPLNNYDLIMRAFYKQSYRMPTLNDLYYTDMGNAYLRPEKARQYNVGFLWDFDWGNRTVSLLRFGCDAYYNDVTDKIIAYPKGQQFRWTMLNLGRVDIRGIDAQAMLLLRLPHDIKLTTKLQYTFQRAIDITSPSDTYYRHQIPYIPRHSGSVVLMAEWRGWNLNYSWIYVGERYNQQENILYNYTQPWYTSDLSLMKNFRIGKVDMRATVEVNNLFSQDYDVILNYPMPKRNYRFGLVVML